MRHLLLTVAAALLLLGLGRHSAEAKMPGYVISGGDLGAYATTVSVWDEDAIAMGPPATVPTRNFDVFRSSGLDLAQRIARGDGPEAQYYPELGALWFAPHEGFAGQWYALAPAGKKAFDDSISGALVAMQLGGPEVGPVAADLRASHLVDMTYWLRPASVTTAPGYRVPINCTACIHLGATRESFIMDDLASMMGSELHTEPSLPPAYVIEGYAAVGISGLLGLYSPPSNGVSGHFWYGSYSPARGYLETTPGFDAFMQQGIERAQESASDAAMPAPSPGETMPLSVWVGVSAAMTAALAGAGAMYARRARRPA